MEQALEKAERHDENIHDGKRTSLVNGILPPSDGVVEAAEEAVEYIRSGDQ